MIIGYVRFSTPAQDYGLRYDELKLAFDASVDVTVDVTDALRQRKGNCLSSATTLSRKAKMPARQAWAEGAAGFAVRMRQSPMTGSIPSASGVTVEVPG